MLAGAVRCAVAAEVDHRRLELAELAEQIERLGRPPGHELEAVPEAAALQLHLDRARLSVEGAWIGPARIGGQEQDGVLHRRPQRRGLVVWGGAALVVRTVTAAKRTLAAIRRRPVEEPNRAGGIAGDDGGR